MAGAFDHHLAALVPGDFRQLAQRLKLGELRPVIGVGDRAGPEPISEREGHIIFAHQIANIAEMLVKEALAVMRQAPFRHDRSAARHDPRQAVGRQVDIAKAHAGMDGEIINPLLALLDQSIPIDLPAKLDGIAVDLLQGLVNRNRADRHRRVANDPFPCVVDVAAGGEVHHRVGAPTDRPDHFLDFFLDG
ncbi:hypothetical protein MnTg02_02689 [bacterium MnTg02]|nr:hypothetical protein MnTg02_02689 [bacterium MnTg02]